MEKVQYLIEMVDGFGSPIKGVIRSSEQLNNTIKGTRKHTGDVNKSFQQLHDQLQRYKDLRDNSFRTDHIRKYNTLIDETQRRMRVLETDTGMASRQSRNMFGVFQQFLPYIGAYQGVTWIKRLAGDAMEAAAQMESYSITIGAMLKSRLGAMERIQEYTDVAVRTPFELSEVVEAGNKLQALGRYSRETLIMLGDLAAGAGKPFEQVLNAYANMVTGQRGESVRMFRDLMIGNQDWVRATGAEIDKMTIEQMEQTLPQIMKEKGFFGLMEAKMESVKGQASNLSDVIFELQNAIGERMQPSQKSFLSGMTSIIESVKEYVEIPYDTKLQQEITNINVLYDELIDTNTEESRRVEIIKEMNRISPELVEGIDQQAINYGKLADNVQKTVDSIREQIFWQRAQKKYEEQLTQYTDYETQLQDTQTKIREMYLKYGITGGTFAEKSAALQAKLQAERSGSISYLNTGEKSVMQDTENQQAKDARALDAYISSMTSLTESRNKQNDILAQIKKENEQLASDLGFSTTPPGGGSGGSGGGGAGGSGGGGAGGSGIITTGTETPDGLIRGGYGQTKQINITLDSLIRENNNIINNTETDMDAFEDKLKATLLTVLNDVNTMAN